MRLKNLALLAAVAMTGCAGPDVWDRPGTTQAEFQQDAAACRFAAAKNLQQVSNANAAPSQTYRSTSNVAVGPDPNARFGAAAGALTSNTEDYKQVLRLCMRSKGYTLRR